MGYNKASENQYVLMCHTNSVTDERKCLGVFVLWKPDVAALSQKSVVTVQETRFKRFETRLHPETQLLLCSESVPDKYPYCLCDIGCLFQKGLNTQYSQKVRYSTLCQNVHKIHYNLYS